MYQNVDNTFYDSLMLNLKGLRKPEVLVLILANSLPIFGVLFFGWRIFPIMALYWAENLVFALFTIIKIATLPYRKPLGWLKNLFYIPYFCLAYGFFILIDGWAVVVLFSGNTQPELSNAVSIINTLKYYQIGLALLALLVSHGVFYYLNYKGERQQTKTTLDQLVYDPYTRITVMQLILLFGGFLVKTLGEVPGLIPLILVKIYIDIVSHQKHQAKIERRKTVLDGIPVNDSNTFVSPDANV